MENNNQENKTIDVEVTSEQTPEMNSSKSSAKDYFKKGMEDAAKKAEEFAPKFKEEVDSLLSEVAYGAGFVPGFVGTIFNEFLPENVKKSMGDGVCKGEEKARSVAQKVREATSAKADDSQCAPPEGA